jgi:hypothetical protein
MKHNEIIPVAYAVPNALAQEGITELRNLTVQWWCKGTFGQNGEEAPPGAQIHLVEPYDGISVSWFRINHRLGKDIFIDRAQAVAMAEKKRAKQIADLEKRIAKLRALSFS